MITSGNGKYKVFMEKKRLGDDLIFVIGGGEKSHIGGAVICQPGQKSYVLTCPNHYDHMVLTPIARTACRKYNRTVIAIGGIHIDKATKEEIQIIVKNCKELVKCI